MTLAMTFDLHFKNLLSVTLFMPPDQMIGGILFFSWFVCVTLTFAITFELQEIETSYLACTLH